MGGSGNLVREGNGLSEKKPLVEELLNILCRWNKELDDE